MLKNRYVSIKTINWETIHNIWSTQLWANRSSPIETHSAMHWLFSSKPPYDASIATKYPATFLGCFVNNQLVGVNSGHQTSQAEYRTRGLWVHPDHRGYGYAQELFRVLEFFAEEANCSIIWSIPRQSALSAYTKFGFMSVGDFFATDTSPSNVYAYKGLSLK